MSPKIRLLAAALLSACASAPPVPPAPRGTVLAYTMPAPSTITYAFTDSSRFDIQGGAIGEITVRIGGAGNAAVTYAQKPTGLEATIRVTEFSGSMTNSATGSGPTATETDIEGAAVITLTAEGAPTITTMPKLGGRSQRVGVGQSFFRRFFVRLPARKVEPGATWVDTVTVSDESAGTNVNVHDIVTSTFVRDTVVNGHTLALISTASERTLNIAGVNEGVEIAQRLTGRSTGTILWDARRNLLVERRETSELSGTFDLPQMGLTGLPVSARDRSHVVLMP
ncbi:MAG: hypothetical protein ACT4O1_06365 [Gemmatimonadota bacterium]